MKPPLQQVLSHRQLGCLMSTLHAPFCPEPSPFTAAPAACSRCRGRETPRARCDPRNRVFWPVSSVGGKFWLFKINSTSPRSQ